MNNSNFSEYLDNFIKKGKINHAYLIETNSENRLELAYALINKIIGLEDIETNAEALSKSDDLYILSTNNNYIKKEQIIELKDKFKTKSIYNKKRFYIIEECEKLNNSSANTLLKFLEEPEDDIIAILITNSIYNVIETIISRCQIIKKIELETNIDYDFKYMNEIIQFIKLIDEKKVKSIAYVNKYFDKSFFERNNFQELLKEFQLIYYDVLQKKVGLDLLYCKDFESTINEISVANTFKALNKKINSINNAINYNNLNGNTKLIFDKMIIDSVGDDNDD